jgi:hypothetical protein
MLYGVYECVDRWTDGNFSSSDTDVIRRSRERNNGCRLFYLPWETEGKVPGQEFQSDCLPLCLTTLSSSFAFYLSFAVFTYFLRSCFPLLFCFFVFFIFHPFLYVSLFPFGAVLTRRTWMLVCTQTRVSPCDSECQCVEAVRAVRVTGIFLPRREINLIV